MVNLRKHGLETFCETESDMGVRGWSGTKRGQGRTTYKFPLLCFYLSLLCLTGNAHNGSTKTSFSTGKVMQTINKIQEQNMLLGYKCNHSVYFCILH